MHKNKNTTPIAFSYILMYTHANVTTNLSTTTMFLYYCVVRPKTDKIIALK